MKEQRRRVNVVLAALVSVMLVGCSTADPDDAVVGYISVDELDVGGPVIGAMCSSHRESVDVGAAADQMAVQYLDRPIAATGAATYTTRLFSHGESDRVDLVLETVDGSPRKQLVRDVRTGTETEVEPTVEPIEGGFRVEFPIDVVPVFGDHPEEFRGAETTVLHDGAAAWSCRVSAAGQQVLPGQP